MEPIEPNASPAFSTRQHLLRMVVLAAMDSGDVSRADLARASGVSKQTMSDVFRELEDDGWLEVSGQTSGSVGRSAATYRIAPRRALLFGADIGGTKIHAAIAGIDGEVLAEVEMATTQDGRTAITDQICDACRRLAREAGEPFERVVAGAIGFPGAFNPQTRTLFMVPNIAGMEGFALADALEARLGFPVRIDNDVNMAAKGEMWRGEGRDIASFVFIALGTGIGMGIINEGRILTGARGAAGEISTLPIGGDPFDTRNFHAGTLEANVGSFAIRGRYEGAGGRAGLSVREIVDAAGDGDAVAAATLTEVARQVAVAIAAISAVVDPQRVVLGGSIGARTELLERIRAVLPLCMPSPPECAVSTLGSRAGLLGAISQSRDQLRAILAVQETARIGRT